MAVLTGGTLFAGASGASAAGCEDEQVAEVIKRDFSQLETAWDPGAPADGLLTIGDLDAAAAARGGYSEETMRATNILRSNGSLLDAFDTAANGGGGDGIITIDDLNAFLGSPGCG